jgi:hypothetical protein
VPELGPQVLHIRQPARKIVTLPSQRTRGILKHSQVVFVCLCARFGSDELCFGTLHTL